MIAAFLVVAVVHIAILWQIMRAIRIGVSNQARIATAESARWEKEFKLREANDGR